MDKRYKWEDALEWFGATFLLFVALSVAATMLLTLIEVFK